MNIQKRLQIEFEFLGDEKISGNTALNIVNQIFEEAETEQLTLTDVVKSLKDKEAISFGRYCASRGYHKYEGNWVNRQRIPRDIEWIKKMYNKEIFDI